MTSFSVNGEEPRLVGELCSGFVLQQFYDGDRITDPANVAYFQVGERWYRLYFECATIYWRASPPPEAAQNSGIASGLLLNDLSGMEGIVGHTFEEVAYEGSASGDVEVMLRFNSGKRIVFRYSCQADATQIVE